MRKVMWVKNIPNYPELAVKVVWEKVKGKSDVI